jgi:hypothetical protein
MKKLYAIGDGGSHYTTNQLLSPQAVNWILCVVEHFLLSFVLCFHILMLPLLSFSSFPAIYTSETPLQQMVRYVIIQPK